MTVFILAAIGLTDAGTGLMCASIMLIACSEGGDMQQDRSTGWRLGTNRVVQFRYQVDRHRSWARCWPWSWPGCS